MKKSLAVGLLATLSFASLAQRASAVDPDNVKKSIDRGVEALKRMQGTDGTWPHFQEVGATALAGLTLLECEVSEDDEAVQKAANVIRKASLDLTHTYSIALSILFLDRLGDPSDVRIIESLMVRLLAGQHPDNGGWTYDCPPINAAEKKKLQEKIDGRKELRGRRDLPKVTEKKKADSLSPDIRQMLQGMERGVAGGGVPPNAMRAGKGATVPLPPGAGGGGAPPGAPPGGRVGIAGGEDVPGLRAGAMMPAGAVPTDNSNTQFAAIALWVGRRQGFPVDKALFRLDQRFRSTQLDDGGWKYTPTPPVPGFMSLTPTMTCAGIICLAIADGATLEAIKEQKPDAKLPDITRDAHLMRGVQVLGALIGNPTGIEPRPQQAGQPGERAGGKTYYFLWSLERVAVALDLETIGKKDWYSWGAEILLASQESNGTWVGDYSQGGPDTCFALLFLKRANLARDLSAHLRGKLKDPGQRVLRGGSKGNKTITPSAIETKAKPVEKPIPTRQVDPEVAKIADELVKATGGRQAELLEKMQTEKGSQYTEALSVAIPQLDGVPHRKARNALAERLTRMKDETLNEYLRDEDPEIRRASALAAAMKGSKSLVPNIIPLLRDAEMGVVLGAYAALKELTGQDFSLTAKSSREECEQAASKWIKWWSEQRKKTVKE